MQNKQTFENENLNPEFIAFIWHAVEINDLEILQLFLSKKRFDIDIVINDVTLLWKAAELGHTDLVKLFLSYGANVKIRGFEQTPLWIAAAFGHSEVVASLLEHGAVIDELCKGCSPLWVAVQNGHLNVVKELIKHHCDVNLPFTLNGESQTPLYHAALSGHTLIVEELVKANANTDIRNEKGLSPLHAASANGHTLIVEILIKARANVNAETLRGFLPLFYAYANNNEKIADLLLEYGSLPDLSQARLNTQFLKYLEIYPRLYPNENKKIDLSDVIKTLKQGMCYGYTKWRRLMMDIGLGEERRNSLQQISVWDGSFEKLQLNSKLDELIKSTLFTLYSLHKTDPVVCNKDVQIADKKLSEFDSRCEMIFNFGFVFKKQEAIKLFQILLQNNSILEISHVNEFGMHIISIQRKDLGYYEIYDCEASIDIELTSLLELVSKAQLLLNANDDTIGMSIKITAKEPVLEEKKKYQEIKSNFFDSLIHERVTNGEIDLRDQRGLTSLFYAIKSLDEEMALKLIANKADVVSTGKEIMAPVYLAAQIGKPNLVQKLIQNGSDVNTQSDDQTLLHIATKLGHIDVVKILISEKVSIDCITVKGFTPLYYACQSGLVDIAEALIAEKANINFKFLNIFTPLYVSIKKDHPDIVKLLIRHGIDINEKINIDDNLYAPIGIAIRFDRLDIVTLLVENGADLSNVATLNQSSSIISYNALEYAITLEKNSLVSYLTGVENEKSPSPAWSV